MIWVLSGITPVTLMVDDFLFSEILWLLEIMYLSGKLIAAAADHESKSKSKWNLETWYKCIIPGIKVLKRYNFSHSQCCTTIASLPTVVSDQVWSDPLAGNE